MPKVLIVDDDKNIGMLYREELIEAGYDVEIVQNGKECIERLESYTPDLIIMDIRMPEMDGIEALGRIIAQRKDIPVILNSAYSSYKDDFRSWGADAYLVKSSDLSELKKTIAEMIDKKQAQ
ncbi:MAG: response regulator [Deltaproteobacteria bacterium]|nr:response regulator [Candidatus Zymogenaceae bacterium]